MQNRKQRSSIPTRELRAGLASRFVSPGMRKRQGTTARTRRGSEATENTVWRRCEMGTNHIACFGVWRRGTRRQKARANRTGTTRWHMPHRGGVQFALPGVLHEVVNQD